MAQKQDPKEVASKQAHGREKKYISTKWKIPLAIVEVAMMAVGKNNKPSRSRALIYAELRSKKYNDGKGYDIPQRKRKVNAPKKKVAARRTKKAK